MKGPISAQASAAMSGRPETLTPEKNMTVIGINTAQACFYSFGQVDTLRNGKKNHKISTLCGISSQHLPFNCDQL